MPKRSQIFLVGALLVLGCARTSPSQDSRTAVPAVASRHLRSEAIQAVKAFFVALDRRDAATLETMVLPDAVIVSDTGVATDVASTMRMIRSSPFPKPQARETYDFQVHALGEVVVVGFLNRITLNMSGKPVERLFNETWVFVRVGGALKLLRAHYSVVGPSVEPDRS